jgi:hypothetical protein
MTFEIGGLRMNSTVGTIAKDDNVSKPALQHVTL